jgi:ABC-type branched-subunit amino acid transport system substrate-binding protein
MATMDNRSSTIKVGILLDFAAGNADIARPFLDSVRLAFDDALEEGLLDRPVELLIRDVDGLPTGTAHAVVKAWQELAADGALVILGPASSENAIALRSYVETVGHVATLSWAGSDRWQGPWTFAVNQGSLVEEPVLMANFLAHRGVRTVCAISETAAIGQEYLAFFRKAARTEGLQIIENVEISQIALDLKPAAKALLAANADAIAYLGFGVPLNRLNKAMEELDWDPLRIATAGILLTPLLEGGMRAARGFCGVDLYDETNPLGEEFLDRFASRFGYRPANYYSTTSYDLANIAAHGVGKAAPLSPEGVKEGLEQIKYLPAVSGGPRTLMSFGPFMRRAYIGQDYLVIRQVIDEDGSFFGTLPSKLVHRMTPRLRSERLKPHAVS